MANKMLIDATHPEETRVVVLRGNRVEEFDFESAHRKQLRGNIYLAKVTRVEPSLQAAFVDYGGNRHGFLAFSEIHPDYYQIPVADRQALIDEEERAQRAADDEVDRRTRRHRHRGRHSAARRDDDTVRGGPAEAPTGDSVAAENQAFMPDVAEDQTPMLDAADETFGATASSGPESGEQPPSEIHAEAPDITAITPPEAGPLESTVPLLAPLPVTGPAAEHDATAPALESDEAEASAEDHHEEDHQAYDRQADDHPENGGHENGGHENGEDEEAGEEAVESVGGADALEEVPDRAPRYRRQYKIQEVIKRRQVMLVQVVKEERGTKGAALTTYLSLAGRYSVLMPNTARGGGISRKITSAEDRARLKEAAQELEVPEGMGVILRTAGASRTKTEIKRDFEYLLRLWETVRDLTLKSTAPKLVYEEGSLVKRSIRDLYGKEIDEVIVAGQDGYNEAKDFMRMLMPSHARNVKLYAETQPLLSRYGVENQLDAMFSPVVQLRSGGYIVLNQAEALVAIDVNSGRATREHHIEDTALKTNLEAADEIARQLRLRDLAGLIVIDFIDMDENRNNRAVERRLKECLKQDRARIQVGRISHFGLLEMSRQRIRTSVLESSTEKCPYCGGSGHVRSVSSLALQVLRALEEQLIRGGTHNLIARTRQDVAQYVLNQKRAHLRGLEERFAISITIAADETVVAPQAFVIDRGEQVHTIEAARVLIEQNRSIAAPLEEEDDLEDGVAAEDEDATEASVVSESAPPPGEGGSRRRRRRGRRGRGSREGGGEFQAPQPSDQGAGIDTDARFEAEAGDGMQPDDATAEPLAEGAPEDAAGHDERSPQPRDGERRRRRRGRRGGRRSRHDREHQGEPAHGAAGESTPDQEWQEQQQDQQQDQQQQPQPSFAPTPEASEAAPPRQPELNEAAADLEAPRREEPPRRRSTVRERAPSAEAVEAATPPVAAPAESPSPQSVATEPDTAEDSTDRPRRSGWWSRRFAGG